MRNSTTKVFIVPPDPTARYRLFVCPYAGGGGLEYYWWNERVPEGVQICPLILPGRETRLGEPALTSMSEVVDELLSSLARHLDKPYSLLGHSMGAWVGYELLRTLLTRNYPAPDTFHVCARQAPSAGSCLPPLHDLPAARFIAEVQERWGALPQKVLQATDLLELIIPAMRADLKILHDYVELQGRPPLDIPIAAWWGEGDAAVPYAQMERWREYTTRRFTINKMQGGHFFHRGPNLTLIRGVFSAIARARRESKNPQARAEAH